MTIESISVSVSPDTPSNAVTLRITISRTIRIAAINHAANRIFDCSVWNDMKMKAMPKTKFSAVMMCQTYVNTVWVPTDIASMLSVGSTADCPFHACVMANSIARTPCNQIIKIPNLDVHHNLPWKFPVPSFSFLFTSLIYSVDLEQSRTVCKKVAPFHSFSNKEF